MSLNEFEIIQRFFSRPSKSGAGIILGIGDDGAVVRPQAGMDLVLAADVLNAGIHFPVSTAAHAIGHKSLAVNLSDLAAMGATPLWFTMTLSLPVIDEQWLTDFSNGLFELADRFGILLVGGDTVKGPLSVGIQVVGQVKRDQALRRDGAKTGDKIYVSGDIGGAAVAVQQVLSGQKAAPGLQRRLDYPVPRVALGSELVGIASSCIDISDGLISDLRHILDASECGANIDLDKVPLAAEVREQNSPDVTAMAISGGDDYELCFTVPGSNAGKLREILEAGEFSASCIGEIDKSGHLTVHGNRNVSDLLGKEGFDHFSS